VNPYRIGEVDFYMIHGHGRWISTGKHSLADFAATPTYLAPLILGELSKGVFYYRICEK